MAYLVGSWRLTAAGYDATNQRLIDSSPFANHLPLKSGTPDFSNSYGGKPALKMDGSAWFGRESLLAPTWTLMMVLHPKVKPGEELRALWGSKRNYDPFGDPGFGNPTPAFETTETANPNGPYLSIYDTLMRFGSSYYPADTAAFVSDAWNVITGIWDYENSQVGIRVNNGAWVFSALPQHVQANPCIEMRLGFAAAAITGGTYHLGALRADLYAGNFPIDDPTAYAARNAALIATPDL